MPLIDDQALNAYIKAAELRAQASICAAHVSTFQEEFGRLFDAWRSANADLLARGEELAAQRGMKGSKPPGIEGFALMQADLLAQLHADDRQRRCDEMLGFLREAQSK